MVRWCGCRDAPRSAQIEGNGANRGSAFWGRCIRSVSWPSSGVMPQALDFTPVAWPHASSNAQLTTHAARFCVCRSRTRRREGIDAQRENHGSHGPSPLFLYDPLLCSEGEARAQKNECVAGSHIFNLLSTSRQSSIGRVQRTKARSEETADSPTPLQPRSTLEGGHRRQDVRQPDTILQGQCYRGPQGSRPQLRIGRHKAMLLPRLALPACLASRLAC